MIVCCLSVTQSDIPPEEFSSDSDEEVIAATKPNHKKQSKAKVKLPNPEQIPANATLAELKRMYTSLLNNYNLVLNNSNHLENANDQLRSELKNTSKTKDEAIKREKEVSKLKEQVSKDCRKSMDDAIEAKRMIQQRLQLQENEIKTMQSKINDYDTLHVKYDSILNENKSLHETISFLKEQLKMKTRQDARVETHHLK